MLCNTVRLLIKNKIIPNSHPHLYTHLSSHQHLLFLTLTFIFQIQPSLPKIITLISKHKPNLYILSDIQFPFLWRQPQNSFAYDVLKVVQVGQNIILRNISQLNLIYYQFVVTSKVLIPSYLMKVYIDFMPQLNSKIFLPFLLSMAMAGITNFWDMTPIGTDVIECLRDSGYLEEAFVLAAFEEGQQQWQVAVDLQELSETGAKTNLILSTAYLQGRLPPQLQAHRVARQFESSKIDKFWLGISNFIGGFKPSCTYLRTFALYLHLYTHKQIGFQSELLFWEDLFGDAQACPELAKYSLYLSFNNFKPFGGWTDYEFYETYRPVPVCNYPGMEVFRK